MLGELPFGAVELLPGTAQRLEIDVRTTRVGAPHDLPRIVIAGPGEGRQALLHAGCPVVENGAVTVHHLVEDEGPGGPPDEGVDVTGSEIVGLVPQFALLDVARDLGSSAGDDAEREMLAVGELGLVEFDPRERVLERVMAAAGLTP